MDTLNNLVVYDGGESVEEFEHFPAAMKRFDEIAVLQCEVELHCWSWRHNRYQVLAKYSPVPFIALAMPDIPDIRTTLAS